jgi:hypothetical protein
VRTCESGALLDGLDTVRRACTCTEVRRETPAEAFFMAKDMVRVGVDGYRREGTRALGAGSLVDKIPHFPHTKVFELRT